MEALLGTSIGVTIGVTIVLMGFAAFMTGQGMARTWQPFLLGFCYCLMLTVADRFLIFALFEGQLLSLTGYLIDFVILAIIYAMAYRITQARMMTTQYPWLYRRAGLFSWRDIR